MKLIGQLKEARKYIKTGSVHCNKTHEEEPYKIKQETSNLKNKMVCEFLFPVLHLSELGEGAAFQLALPDGGFTEHGLRLRHPALRCVHGGDGGEPVQQQQSMMGHGV